LGIFDSLTKKSGSEDGKSAKQSGVNRDPRKARRFFEHAQTTADSRQYDYSIECYINGLRHEPDNMRRHEELKDVALKRKVGGGKPAGFSEKMKSGGKDPVDKMLQAERLWAMDPTNLSLLITAMEKAVVANENEEEINLGEVAYWFCDQALEKAMANKKQNKATFIRIRDGFAAVRAFGKAVEACRLALQLDDRDTGLLQDLKDLEAERTMEEGGYSQAASKEGSARDVVRDSAKQRELEQDEGVVKTEEALQEIIDRAREAYEANPEPSTGQKYVRALLRRDTEESESIAMQVLEQLHEQTDEYRYKMELGNIKIRQMTRQARQAKADFESDPEDSEAKERYQKLVRERIEFELGEYEQRVKNYPTDAELKFKLGQRYFAVGRIDEAIDLFQQTKGDPKHRAGSMEYLGRCYIAQEWHQEAIDTLRQGIEMHKSDDDKLALELRYLLMDALEKQGTKKSDPEMLEEAQKVGSKILQTNIKFRDIRDRVNKLREKTAG